MAQKLGYAERNPSADVDGHDACRKICILAALAFGKHVYPEQVHTEGISTLTLADVAYAKTWGGRDQIDRPREKNGKRQHSNYGLPHAGSKQQLDGQY